MHKNELTAGALKYRLGLPYKDCKTIDELNEWTQEERVSRCGFMYESWYDTKNAAGKQLVMNVPENNTAVPVFHAERVKASKEKHIE